MNNRALTLSVVMALLAVFFVQSYVTSIEEEARKKFGTEVLVVSARRDISEMTTINETMLELKKIPKRFLEPGGVSFETKKEEIAIQNMSQLAGSVALVPIRAGEQLTYNKITEPSLRTGLAPQIAPGKRAISISIDDTRAVSKLIKPGDRVDLIVVADLGGRNRKLAKTLLQDVLVLAVGKYVSNNIPRLLEMDPISKKVKTRSLINYTAYSNVTLEVDPIQAQAIALLQSEGSHKLVFSLRNNEDTSRVPLGSLVLEDVIGKDAARIPGGVRR